jgi:eukaryotic-like serine/threonine-protein kinase
MPLTTRFELLHAAHDATSSVRRSPLVDSSMDSDDARARLRRGLQMSTGLMALVTTAFTIGVVGFAVPTGGLHAILRTPSLWAHVGTAVLLVASSIAAGRRAWTTSELRLLDDAVTIATGLGIALFSAGKPPGMGRELVLLVFMAHVLMLRAAVVPSSGLRTLALGAAALAPTLLRAFSLPPSTTFAASRLMPLTFTMLFGITTLLVSALVSRRIYGLQRDFARASRLGQYELEEKIGEGGMGEVYRARHALLRRPTAVKLLLPSLVGERALARFEREVQLTSQLSHPSTVQVYDFGRSVDGTFYYAMEYIDGLTLTQLVDLDGPQPAGRVAHLLAQVCGSLEEAHGMGLVHRDVKPDNVLVCRRGHAPDLVKVVDFGLATPAARGAEDPDERVIGTPHYMAPEAVLAPYRVDARTDVYAVGALAYFLLTGTHLFDGAIDAVLAQQVHSIPERPSSRLGAEVPAGLERIVLRCLAKAPGERPQTAAELRVLFEAEAALGWDRAASARWWEANDVAVSSTPPAAAHRVRRRITVARTRPC